MATDKSLNLIVIEGAGKAILGPGEMPSPQDLVSRGLSIDQGVNAVTKHLMKKAQEKENQKQVDAFNKAAQKILDQTDYMTEGEFGDLAKRLEEMSSLYANLPSDDPEAKVLMSKLDKISQQIMNKKNDILTIAKTINPGKDSPSQAGLNDMFKTSLQGSFIKDIFNGEISLTYNKDADDYGYNIYSPKIQEERRKNAAQIRAQIHELDPLIDIDEIVKLGKELDTLEGSIFASDLHPGGDTQWTSTGDIISLLEEQSFDIPSFDILTQSGKHAELLGSNVPQGHTQEFNYTAGLDMVRNEIVKKGNKRSLINDDILGTGMSFRETLEKELREGTYEDLGILAAMDPTGSGNGVTETDASTIVNTLISTDLYL